MMMLPGEARRIAVRWRKNPGANRIIRMKSSLVVRQRGHWLPPWGANHRVDGMKLVLAVSQREDWLTPWGANEISLRGGRRVIKTTSTVRRIENWIRREGAWEKNDIHRIVERLNAVDKMTRYCGYPSPKWLRAMIIKLYKQMTEIRVHAEKDCRKILRPESDLRNYLNSPFQNT